MQDRPIHQSQSNKSVIPPKQQEINIFSQREKACMARQKALRANNQYLIDNIKKLKESLASQVQSYERQKKRLNQDLRMALDKLQNQTQKNQIMQKQLTQIMKKQAKRQARKKSRLSLHTFNVVRVITRKIKKNRTHPQNNIQQQVEEKLMVPCNQQTVHASKPRIDEQIARDDQSDSQDFMHYFRKKHQI